METYSIIKMFEDFSKKVIRTGQSQSQVVEFLREREREGFRVNFETMIAKTLSGRTVFTVKAEG